MIKKVKLFIDRYHLLAADDIVVAACSGGADSLALVHILCELRSSYAIRLIVAHVDHMIRGQEAAADSDFVAEFCRQRGLSCFRTKIDVPAFVEGSGRSTEDAARMLRYRYLRQVAAEAGGAKIATGHHLDDQAETVLLHLLRGAGADGLKGMQPYSEGVIRPLLGVTREEVEDYCRRQGLSPRLDSTNLQTDYLRNSIRLELFPYLEERYNPAIKASLCRTAAIIGDEHAYIRLAAQGVWQQVVKQGESPDSLLLDKPAFVRQHVALQRELFRMVVEKKQGHLRGISFYHVEKMIEMMLYGRVGSECLLPGGLLVRKTYAGLEIGAKPCKQSSCVWDNVPEILLEVPGVTVVAELGCIVHARFIKATVTDKNLESVVLDADQITPPLMIRTRLPGDRFTPAGMKNGSKKIKDFFIDAKVAREKRSRIPIVCDAEGILWVCGFRQAERARVTHHTQKFLQLTVERREEKDGTDNG
ncbi:hypothetical protein P22_2546 [Propionispora sp. 2/2-37]|uniref:tRNA lysidine(34) synthetase TilS n=1 Tax=Propionispora sp. 2/2-37 TaxID=1677858 RepID=UPI0006BB6E49|nr:tRNA lysidine(34) synthetase TilS [Propionispora sp. 2/2-37]CUH96456.1 hypothetical protein P22_2546 [Propionispora sp. 2/2-37]